MGGGGGGGGREGGREGGRKGGTGGMEGRQGGGSSCVVQAKLNTTSYQIVLTHSHCYITIVIPPPHHEAQA